MPGVSLIVLLVAQDAGDPSIAAFERTVRSVLGPSASLKLERVAEDPADEDSAARGVDVDGVVELSSSPDHSTARLHCYVSRQARWVDREITFGGNAGSQEQEASERGRLLGFAVATMFAEDSVAPSRPVPAARPTASRPAQSKPSRERARARTRSLELAGIASSGLDGTASGLGASAGARFQWVGPLTLRGFVAGRAGNVPEAQAVTRTGHVGAGLSWGFLPSAASFELGVRADALLSYFQASHFSEDDIVPNTKSRWLPGFDGLLEGGFRFMGNAGLFTGVGIEAMLGSTELYTHGRRVAVVPPFRLVGELGLRARF
ncbi:MAG TPA: hypothetical protein VJN18_04190 [Polyangiaceae bacterium]|nr:hypothetical protein [Polyangiaceae bacterium]